MPRSMSTSMVTSNNIITIITRKTGMAMTSRERAARTMPGKAVARVRVVVEMLGTRTITMPIFRTTNGLMMRMRIVICGRGRRPMCRTRWRWVGVRECR